MKKRILVSLLITGLLLSTTTVVEAARITTNRKLNSRITTNEKLTNGCGTVSPERLNNNPNTAPDCYGVSQIGGDFATRSDIDWVRQFPFKGGTQEVRVCANGRTRATLYRGRRWVHRGSIDKSGCVILDTKVNINVPGQDILGVQLSGDRGVTYTVYFPEVKADTK